MICIPGKSWCVHVNDRYPVLCLLFEFSDHRLYIIPDKCWYAAGYYHVQAAIHQFGCRFDEFSQPVLSPEDNMLLYKGSTGCTGAALHARCAFARGVELAE